MILSRILNDVARSSGACRRSPWPLVCASAAMVPFVLVIAFAHEWRMSLLATVALTAARPGRWCVLGRELRRAAHDRPAGEMGRCGPQGHRVGRRRRVSFRASEWRTYEIGRFRTRRGRRRAACRSARPGEPTRSPWPFAVMELFGAVVGAGRCSLPPVRGIAAGELDAGQLLQWCWSASEHALRVDPPAQRVLRRDPASAGRGGACVRHARSRATPSMDRPDARSSCAVSRDHPLRERWNSATATNRCSTQIDLTVRQGPRSWPWSGPSGCGQVDAGQPGPAVLRSDRMGAC